MRQITREDMHSVKDFLMKTTNGMAIGLFGTLIIGTILSVFADIPGLETVDISFSMKEAVASLEGKDYHFELIVEQPN